jgi:hypothetical protein
MATDVAISQLGSALIAAQLIQMSVMCDICLRLGSKSAFLLV